MGGVGKTQLAVEFAHRYGRFFHGVHWLDAAQPDALGTEIAACGLKMGLQPWPDTLPEQLNATLHAWQTGGPRLVIFDNLEDVPAAREWLAALSGGPLRLLLTARRSNWPHDLGLAALPLDVFTPQESRDFLRAAGVAGSAGDLESLAKRLGHLPLALELAARYLRAHRRLNVTAYLGKLDHVLTDPAMQNWRADLGNPTGHDLDLLATFAVSWEQLRNGLARRLFLLAGYCAPNAPLPFTLLQEAAELETGVCDEALGRLEGLGLLRAGETETGPAIHPLLAEYARALPTAPAFLPALADVLARQASAANKRVDQTGELAVFTPLLPHLRPVAGAAEGAGLTDAAALWNELGYHLHTLADYAGARAAFERALAIDEATFGPDHPKIAIRVNNLGSVLQDLGDLTGARAAYERSLAIWRAAYGEEHPRVATAHNNLGGVLYVLGDLTGARTAYERALAIFERFLPPEHPHIRSARESLARVKREVSDL